MAGVDAKTAFGRAVKAVRVEQGISQEELADLASLQRPTLSLIETGSSDVRLGTIYKLAEALGMTPSVLLARAEAIRITPRPARAKKS